MTCLHCRVLIERLGFQSTFLVTAAIKALSFAPLLLLLGLLDEQLPCCGPCWRSKPVRNAAVNGGGPEPDLASGEDPLRAPLLAGAGDAAQEGSNAVQRTAGRQEEAGRPTS